MAIVTHPHAEPAAAQPGTRPAVQPGLVIGVDTHTDTHSVALLTRTGAVLAEATISADPAGHTDLLAWAAQHAATGIRWWAVEGARSHGVALTRALQTHGEHVLEAPRPKRRGRRTGKSDALDAIAAARAVLADLDTALTKGRPAKLGMPRTDGDRETIRILHTTRRHYTDARTATINVFKSLILTAEDTLRTQLQHLSTAKQVRAVLHTEPTTDTDTDTGAAVRLELLRTLATQIRGYTTQINRTEKHLTTLINQLNPELLNIYGVGPITAAVLLSTWSHHGRVRSEAAYAALAGASPIPASSGRNEHMRLNRGGDRTLNAALHTIANARRRGDKATIDYVNRRRTDPTNPKTDREIQRILKRYLARKLYRQMQANTTP
jgi:transposase